MASMPTENIPAVEISLAKADLRGRDSPYAFPAVPIADALPWPVSPDALYTLYNACVEHQRAINIKAQGAFGGGLVEVDGEGTKPVAAVEDLCETGSGQLFEEIGLDLDTYANAFLYIIRDARRRILRLERRPAKTMWRKAQGGYVQIQYDYSGKILRTDYTGDEIIHLRHACPGAHWYAVPNWYSGSGMAELVDAAIRFNQAFFDNNTVPDHAMIVTGATLNDEQKLEVKNYLRREHAGAENAHRLLLLSFNDQNVKVDIKALANPHDGEFLKLLDAAKERVPIAHGVPPRMLGIVSAGQLGGGGEVAGQFHTFNQLTLIPMRRRMVNGCGRLWKDLGIDRTRLGFADIDPTPPEPAPSPADLAQAVMGGLLNVDEARGKLGLQAQQSPMQKSSRTDILLEIFKSL